MERVEISTANINLSEIVKHVSRDRVSEELSEGQVPLARIVRIDQPHSMTDFNRALIECPRLGEDAEAYAPNVLAVRKSYGPIFEAQCCRRSILRAIESGFQAIFENSRFAVTEGSRGRRWI